MKKTLAILAALAIAGALLAQSISYTAASHFWRFQCDAQYDASGNVTAAPTQAFYHTVLTGSDGSTFPGADQTVTWDAIASGNVTVPITLADGTTATTTRAAVLQAIETVAAQVKATTP